MSYSILRYLLCAALLLPFGSAWAVDFPPITDAERALTEVPSDPGAPAVVLFEKAEVKLMDYPAEASSFLKVRTRIKILTEEGKSFGEEEIYHSAYWRLKKVEGRTVLPSGEVVPLPKDAIFEERRSRSGKSFVTKLVFPAVEVGAILDYFYEVRWNDLMYLDPWYFHNRIPTLRSEITYIKPNNLALVPWGAQIGKQEMKSTSEKTPLGSEITIWIEDLPGVPAEDYSFPLSDLSSRFMMVPKEVGVSGSRIPLMDTWRSTCELFADDYKNFRRRNQRLQKKAVELTQGMTDAKEKMAVLHAFVRDEIQTLAAFGVTVREDIKGDKVLKERQGVVAEKALLLQSMLAAVGVASDLVWVADRTSGSIDLKVANYHWFDSMIVQVGEGDGAVYLDPNDHRSGFGHLAPYYEGTPALVYDKKKPVEMKLPKSTAQDNFRFGQVDLTVDEDGALAGTGTINLKGQEAWVFMHWKDTEEETLEAWGDWLQDQYEGFGIGDVDVAEDPIQQTIQVSWSLTQREEEVLGDEVTVPTSLPFGPVTQLFSLPTELRKTPVQLLFARGSELVTTVTWPEGWEIDVLPANQKHSGPVGVLNRSVEVDEAARKATIVRYFERRHNEFVGSDTYDALRKLYAETADADAQALVLIGE